MRATKKSFQYELADEEEQNFLRFAYEDSYAGKQYPFPFKRI
jgi:hypothetical protein